MNIRITNTLTDTVTAPLADARLRPNWRHVAVFLGLTFGLTWLLDLAIYLRGGLAAAGVITILQLQMLLPAFSAILLGLFFFRESPIYRGRPAGPGRWFYYYFLALTAIYALGALGMLLASDQPALAMLARAGRRPGPTAQTTPSSGRIYNHTFLILYRN